MVDIVFQPVKKLMVMECTLYPEPETLASTLRNTVEANRLTFLSWAEGMVFITIPYPIHTEVLTEDIGERHVYWVTIAYASMPKYKKSIPLGDSGISVVDVTPSETLKQIAVWLNKRAEGKIKSE